MHIDVLRPQSLSPDLAARWRSLQRLRRGWESPLFSPEWSRAVERARGDDGVKVAVVSDRGEARAFMAFSAGKMTAMAAGGALCDYEGLVGDPGPGFDPRGLLRALGVGRYDFSHVLDDAPAFGAFGRGQELSWMVDAPDGYEAYAAGRRAAGVSALKELDRKRRKVEREIGAPVFTARSASKADFARLIELKRAQYRATSQTDVLAPTWTRQLLQDLFERQTTDDFGAELFTLHIGGELAAVQFHLLGERIIHAWMIGHEATFERYSPGLLLFQDILRWMDGEAYDRLDFGYGDYRFKRELSNAQQTLLHGFVGQPSAVTLVREAAYGVRRVAEALPLGRASALPGKAMRRLDLMRGLR
ncbi:MAG TPA: GNAT family N-acetyltransferase [Caulobacteraceae bacterium]|nr:GNAT family N-acetyltransferase [Caulobacteraceae bacterium]